MDPHPRGDQDRRRDVPNTSISKNFLKAGVIVAPAFCIVGTVDKMSGGHLLCADRSGTETQQPDADGSVLKGIGDTPQQAEKRAGSTCALLAQEIAEEKSHEDIWTTL